MMLAVATPGVGPLLREWRQRRRLSQLALALEAEVSARHLSFVETGRSQPSRELLLHLAEHLDVPARERNDLLLAAGYAPAYPETPLDAEAMVPVRLALDRILASHRPFPAVIVDRRWDLVSGNDVALALFSEGVSAELVQPPVNTMRLSLHPDGLAPRVANLGEYSAHLLERLDRQLARSFDPALSDLCKELRTYPGVEEPSAQNGTAASMLYVPLRLRAGDATGGDLAFFTTLATFGTAVDITLDELAIESFFPADAITEASLRNRFV